jgi:hypothetical protein
MADSSLPQKDDETDDAPIAGAKPPIIYRSPRRGSDTFIRDLKVEIVQVSVLRPYARNPRTHSTKQLSQIADSIRCFGWTNPILIDADGGVIAGHGRLEAARLLGVDRVPTIRIEDMTEAQKRAYILADNKLAENAGWDRELLGLELQGLLEMELDFEVTMTGFEMGEIDVGLQMHQSASPSRWSCPALRVWRAACQFGDPVSLAGLGVDRMR